MKVVLHDSVVNIISNFSELDLEKLSLLFSEMESEKFPKINTFLRSDIPSEKGTFIRKFKDFRIVYQFDEIDSIPRIVVLSIYKKE